jgi:hypothetical protein
VDAISLEIRWCTSLSAHPRRGWFSRTTRASRRRR